MNFNHLRYFQSVCKFKNVTKASLDIHISQPTVTAAIKDLENELDIQLFYRINNRIQLTPEGESFLKMVNEILKGYDDFYARSLDLGQQKNCTLRIGLPTVLGTFLLSKILPDFENAHPNIHLEIYEVPTFTGAKMIEEATLDFAIGVMDTDIYTGCNYKQIYQTNLVLAAGADNPLAKEKAVTKEMLIDQPFVILPSGSYHYKAITEQFDKGSLNVILHSNQLSTISYLLKNNLAVTILYKEIFNKKAGIVTVPLAEAITTNIGIFWRKNSYVSAAMKSFVKFMTNI